MKTIYSSTRPGRGDTRAITKGKWLQHLRGPSNEAAGTRVIYSNPMPRASDTQFIALQKILATSQAPFSVTVGLMAHWPLNDGNYLDVVGGHNLTASGSPTLGEGKISAQAVQFTPATSDYLVCDSAAALQFNGPATFTGWIYVDSLAASGGVVSKTDVGNYEYALATNTATNGLRCLTYKSGLASNSNAITISTGRWIFFAWTYEPAGLFSTNILGTDSQGNLVTANLVKADSSDAAFKIGMYRSSTGTAFYFPGRIESVSLWNRVLTGAEKLYLYNNGAGRAYPF